MIHIIDSNNKIVKLILFQTVLIDKNDKYVEISLNPEVAVTIRIVYAEDKEKQKIGITSKDNKLLIVTLYNFQHSQGSGTPSRLKLGKVGTKSLYMHVWSYKQGTADKYMYKLDCAFYLEENRESEQQ